MSEELRPHTAVISVQLEVHSLLDTGECSGKIVSSSKLKENGIDYAFLATVSGSTLEKCLEKLKAKLEVLQDE
jgi:hypothetical protein